METAAGNARKFERAEIMNLIQVAIAGGRIRAAWLDADSLAIRDAEKARGERPKNLAIYKASGAHEMARWPREFDWHKAYLAYGNIMERGTPKLAGGWQGRAETKRLEMLNEWHKEAGIEPLTLAEARAALA